MAENVTEQEMNILDLYNIDAHTAQELFQLCNEFASKLTVQNQFNHAQILIEQGILLSKYMSKRLQSLFLSNVCCFYERKNELATSKLYYEAANKMWKEYEEEFRAEGTPEQ